MNKELISRLYSNALGTILEPYIDETGTARYIISDHVEGRTRLLFAELIVRECCDQIREIDAMKIREHFGIED